MRIGNLDVVAPGLVDEPWNEAEAFGSAVWLWMHSAAHRDVPLHTLNALLLPAIKHRQFVLASQAGQPVFYLAWANLSAEAERRYLHNPPVCMPQDDWASGDRMWVLDWVAPFGHTHQMSRLVTRRLFAGRCFRALYHRRSLGSGPRVKDFAGIAVMPQEARAWFETHPVASAQE